jgi:hypothetical protein
MDNPKGFRDRRLKGPDARELETLAAVYRYVLDRNLKQETAPESRPDDAKEKPKDEFRAATSIP